jgi:hypothetical protein
MADEHREDFERRLLAKVRSSLDYLDETYPDGYEIEHFVLTFRYYTAPDSDSALEPWDGGRYVGMYPSGFTTGSSSAYMIDEWLLREALDHTVRQREGADDDSDGDEDEVEEEDLSVASEL